MQREKGKTMDSAGGCDIHRRLEWLPRLRTLAIRAHLFKHRHCIASPVGTLLSHSLGCYEDYCRGDA